MPPYRFTAPIPYQYPATRDTSGIHLGEVAPGDVRDLDSAPDRWWVPADGSPAPEAEAESAPEPASEPEPPGFDMAGPQPAPPAIVA